MVAEPLTPFQDEKIDEFERILADAREILGTPDITVLNLSGKSGETLGEICRFEDPIPYRGILITSAKGTSDISVGYQHLVLTENPDVEVLIPMVPYDQNGVLTVGMYIGILRTLHVDLLRAAIRENSVDQGPPYPILHPLVHRQFQEEVVQFLKRGQKPYQEYGLPYRRGILLIGPPGNGKTSLVRWLVAWASARGAETRTITPELYLSARSTGGASGLFRFDELKSSGRPMASLPRVGDKEKELEGRGVVVFDDIDRALLSREGSSLSEGWDQAIFLNALQGPEQREGVLCVFTTNAQVTELDEAICRPGRIDAVIPIDRPDGDAILSLAQTWPEMVRKDLPPGFEDQLKGKSYAWIVGVYQIFAQARMDGKPISWAEAVQHFEELRKPMEKGGPMGLRP